MNARRPLRVLLLATLAACSGGGGGGSPTFDFGADALLLRVGEPVTATATTATGADFAVAPALPVGLQLDGTTGAITGTPSAVTAGQDHVVTGRLGNLQVQATVRIAVGAALPAEVSLLETGFAVERVTTLALPPAKMALAPDGRVFVTELGSGVLRLVDPTGALQPTPFVTVPVLTGSHRGLLGVALSPTFATDGRVFALACTPAGGGHCRVAGDGRAGRDAVGRHPRSRRGGGAAARPR